MWVNRVVLTVIRALPVFPRERTWTDRSGRSVQCQNQPRDRYLKRVHRLLIRPLPEHMELTIPDISGDLGADPVRHLDQIAFPVQLDLGNDDAGKDAGIHVDFPCKPSMGNVVSHFLENAVVAHETQHLFSISHRNGIFEFGAAWTFVWTFDRDGRNIVQYAHARFAAVLDGDEAVPDTCAPDDRCLPSIMRNKKLAFDFKRHGYVQTLQTGQFVGRLVSSGLS
jgi:hypothetical protein